MPLSKKEIAQLRSKKAQITKTQDGSFIVQLCLTEGETLALRNAAVYYGQSSPVGADVGQYLTSAAKEAKLEDF